MMKMRFVGLVALVAIVACVEEPPHTSEPNTDSETASQSVRSDGKTDQAGEAEVPPFHWVDTWDRWTTEALDPCGYNDSSRVGTFDVASFDPSEVMAELHRADGICEAGRSYSNSRENGVAMFFQHVEEDELTNECVTNQVSAYQWERAQNIINDPNNLGVFASAFPENGEDAEACLYYHFYIFRPDGTLLRWTFSYTD